MERYARQNLEPLPLPANGYVGTITVIGAPDAQPLTFPLPTAAPLPERALRYQIQTIGLIVHV